jgi:hypothetical protein
VLFAGISNAHAHLHLCFDGQEPPAAVHLADGDAHEHRHETDGTHDDVDVDIAGQVIAKSFKHDLAILPPVMLVGIGAVPTRSYAPPSRTAPRPPPPPLYYRPPLRGPPR